MGGGGGGGGGGGLESPGEAQVMGSSLPQLNGQEVVDALGKWEGMEDTIALFADLVKESSKSSPVIYHVHV